MAYLARNLMHSYMPNSVDESRSCLHADEDCCFTAVTPFTNMV